ncbi:hypothetical protein O181_089248 [Austropuccinia psidii MF-1]|uniref:Uncharacterized protein n=1 Tax=Austropuccinia psidii MF-1 TaxID=1389203 RepID=A0A9Q3ISX1_9BASI|nr:hypothetical protein [Austropuccinia psidii MF-1]
MAGWSRQFGVLIDFAVSPRQKHAIALGNLSAAGCGLRGSLVGVVVWVCSAPSRPPTAAVSTRPGARAGWACEFRIGLCLGFFPRMFSAPAPETPSSASQRSATQTLQPSCFDRDGLFLSMSDLACQRRVYVACRFIFTADKAKFRKAKTVKNLVFKYPSLRPLRRDLGEDRLVSILQRLLADEVFESEKRARARFPDLFLSSTVRDAQRQVCETVASHSTAVALDKLVSEYELEANKPHEKILPSLPAQLQHVQELEPPSEQPSKTQTLKEKIPSLYPLYLSYQAQHLILNTVQRVLEECCFDFSKNLWPSVIETMKWDCPPAVELTQFLNILRKRTTIQLPELEIADLQDLLAKLSTLRNVAVHRIQVTANTISTYIKSAVKLAQALQDNLRAGQLEALRYSLNCQLEAMEMNKNLLQNTVLLQLTEIQKQREALEKSESDVVKQMLNDDLNNRIMISKLLEKSLETIFSKTNESEKIHNKVQDNHWSQENKLGPHESKEEEDQEEDEDQILLTAKEHIQADNNIAVIDSEAKPAASHIPTCVDPVQSNAKTSETSYHVPSEDPKHSVISSSSTDTGLPQPNLNLTLNDIILLITCFPTLYLQTDEYAYVFEYDPDEELEKYILLLN